MDSINFSGVSIDYVGMFDGATTIFNSSLSGMAQLYGGLVFGGVILLLIIAGLRQVWK